MSEEIDLSPLSKIDMRRYQLVSATGEILGWGPSPESLSEIQALIGGTILRRPHRRLKAPSQEAPQEVPQEVPQEAPQASQGS